MYTQIIKKIPDSLYLILTLCPVGVVNSCVLYRQSNCHAEVLEQSLEELWEGRALKGCGSAFKARIHIALENSDCMCVCLRCLRVKKLISLEDMH